VARNLRPGPNLALVVVLALGVCTPAFAQTADDYATLVDAYASNNISSAINRLNRWPREEVAHSVTLWLERLPPNRQAAATMLHTELAASLVNVDNVRSVQQLELARRWLDRMNRRKTTDRSVEPFVERWFTLAASLSLLRGDINGAAAMVRDGLGTASGHHAKLLFYSGMILEINAGRLPSRVFNRANTAEQPNPALERAYIAATMEFRRALNADPRLFEARLHIGWIHTNQHRREAREELEAAAVPDASPSTRFLAHLFLARLAELENRLPDAKRECEEALALGPRFQTAYVALMRVAEAMGDGARAREIAAKMVGLQKADDPWWNYLGGIDGDALEWLRAAVHTS
jgi:tetratricopeptide (TPR) repeat protein